MCIVFSFIEFVVWVYNTNITSVHVVVGSEQSDRLCVYEYLHIEVHIVCV